MPLYDEYSEQLRSEIADMINSGGRPAGACTAAMFLQGVRRRPAVGPPRHRRHGVGRRGEAVPAEGADRRRGAHARGAARCGADDGDRKTERTIGRGASPFSVMCSASESDIGSRL